MLENSDVILISHNKSLTKTWQYATVNHEVISENFTCTSHERVKCMPSIDWL